MAERDEQQVAQQQSGPRVVMQQLPNSKSVPINAPTKSTQLNPIIQPLALVPYNTMSQPLYQIVEE